MKGSTRKRGKSWSYYFDAAPIGGKRKKIEKGGFRTKKEAETALAKALTQYDNAGTLQEPSTMSVSDFLDEWYQLYCVPNLSANTLRNYKEKIENHLKPRFGHYRLRAVKPAIIQEYINEIKLNGFAHSQVKNIFILLSQAFNYAVEPLQYISQNPCQFVKVGKMITPPRERIILTDTQFETILNRFPVGNRFHIPLLIGWHCGLRIGECFGLTWGDIDFENHTINIHKQMTTRKINDVNCWVLQQPKNNSCRIIPFGETLYQALKTEQKRQKTNELQYGEYYTIQVLRSFTDHHGIIQEQVLETQKLISSDLPRFYAVCVDENGTQTTPMSFKYCSRIIHHELNMAFDYHSLRHTHATKLVKAGANIKAVQQRLGHKDITTTMNTYVHHTKNMANEVVELFEKSIATK